MEKRKGDHLTHAALDCQARSYWGAAPKLPGRRGACAVALSGGSRVHRRVFRLFICRGDCRPAAPAQSGSAAADPPQASGHHQRCAAFGGAHHVSDSLQDAEGLFTQAPELQKMRWLATDKVAGSLAQEWRDPAVTSNTLALLQYTSGSTAEPKGVMISHGNLLHNSAYISRALRAQPGRRHRHLAAGLP